jgi:hypothetical protein
LQSVGVGDLSVSTTKIQDNAITTAKIAAGAVVTVDIADANITAAKLDGAQSGSAPIYGARAWVNFNGTGTVAIRASGNVSSITDNGTGDYTVNFATAMPDANYSVVAIGQEVAGPSLVAMYVSRTSPYATGSIRLQGINSSGLSNTDTSFVNVAVFR